MKTLYLNRSDLLGNIVLVPGCYISQIGSKHSFRPESVVEWENCERIEFIDDTTTYVLKDCPKKIISISCPFNKESLIQIRDNLCGQN